jgi:aminoglycoside 6-adenylyltransferase
MRTEKKILNQINKLSVENNNLCAAVLTSSRGGNSKDLDYFSDYDIELYVYDLSSILENDNWLSPLGDIMVRWPLRPRTTFNENWITRGIIFNDGLRIDFQITDNLNIQPTYLDYGYKVLFDKEKILKNLPKPTFTEFNIKKPTLEEYEIIVKEFWWNASYVPKYLWRNELPFAKFMMNSAIHHKYLKKVIEWYIGFNNDWQINPGIAGRFFKRYLSQEIWLKYEFTFSGAGIEDNWKAFFNAISLFSKLAKEVGTALGYKYPSKMEKEMTNYYKSIKNTERD